VSEPKLSISACTTWTTSFEDDLAAYRGAGAQGIGLWEFKLPRGRDEESVARLRDSGLRATVCVPEVPSIVPDPFFTDPPDPAARRDALAAAIRRLAAFDPVAVLVLTGSPAGRGPEATRRLVVDGLRAAADVAGELGLTLALEPYRADAGSLVTELPDTVALLEEIGQPNVELVVDSWHIWDLQGIHDHLRRYVDRIVALQINDRREPPRSWCDRVLPGDGELDLAGMFTTLEDAGFDGWYDVEVFSDSGLFGHDYPDSVWKRDPREVAASAVGQFGEIWRARRTGATVRPA
jgi:sugar phosphate isomerase/epimerase